VGFGESLWGRGIFLWRVIYRGRSGSFIDWKGPMGLNGAPPATHKDCKYERIGPIRTADTNEWR
jgi:hypothetical protein